MVRTINRGRFYETVVIRKIVPGVILVQLVNDIRFAEKAVFIHIQLLPHTGLNRRFQFLAQQLTPTERFAKGFYQRETFPGRFVFGHC
ncbi:MAG: hypothetical protein GF353_02495 [Candidatus Lokiarchaeota archaeon]|nr:hypothetical protein [Candidatus Lokiarchaeota archaeon]